MIKKYTIYNQLTGHNIEVSTYAEAVSVQNTLISEYMETLKDAFAISVSINNDDGSWTYHHPDENGDPVIASIPVSTLGEGTI
jgi:hypothetical protein